MIGITQLLRRVRKGSRQRRKTSRSNVAGIIRSTERLEHRALLTMAVNFDFTVIASNLSPSLRLFGSTDPADAPFEVIRYGQGTVTGLVGFDGGALLATPGDVTFQFGSMDTSNPVEAMKLQFFDDGVADGVADQRYGGSEASTISFSYQGAKFAEATINSLSLRTSQAGEITGTGQFDTLTDFSVPPANRQTAIRDLLNRSFPSDSGRREFTLGTFGNDGTWSGAGDGEIFRSGGILTSLDDIPDVREFATPWLTTSPFQGSAPFSNFDWLKADLDPAQTHTLQISADGTGSTIVEVFSDNDELLFASSNSNWSDPFTVNPVSSTTWLRIRNDSTAVSWQAERLDSAPASLHLYRTSADSVAWTPELDGQGNALPADGYRVTFESGGQTVHQEDVDNSTMVFSLAGHVGLSAGEVAVERILSGSAVGTSQSVVIPGQSIRGNITGFDGTTFTWDAIPGAQSYQLFLHTSDDVVNLQDTSYTLPVGHPIGWRRAWVRGIADDGTPGLWSFPKNYHARSALVAPSVDTSNPLRPVISWPELNGAETYELLLDNLTTGQSGVIHETALANDPRTYTPSQDLSVGTHQLWMRGVSSAGVRTGWAPAVTINVAPETVSVAEGNSPLQPAFTWSDVPGVVGVDLYILNDGVVTEMSNLPGSSYSATTDFRNGNVSWWVRGVDGSGNRTRWSDVQTVRLGNTFLSGPTGTLPAFSRPSYAWIPVVGAANYELLVRSLTDGDIFQVTDLTGTTYQHQDSLPGNRYTVWVNTIFAADNAWSNPVTYDVQTHRAREITSPVSGATVSTTPTVQWIPDNVSHERTHLFVRNLDDGSVFQVSNIVGTSYTFESSLTSGDTYRIWARPSSGSWGKAITVIVQ